MKKGTYTRLIGKDPEIMRIVLLFPLKRILLLSSLCRLVQSNVVNINRARAAGGRYIALCPHTDRDFVDVGQIDALRM